jgi:hypothetical protein
MKIYVLVTTKDGEPTLDMPVHFGRSIRAYTSKARAKVYAKKFDCYVIEVDLTKGEMV